MDDQSLIELVEGIRRGIGEWVSDIDSLFASAVIADYHTASAWELQSVLAQVVTGLDPRRGPGEMRKVQRWINRAEAIGGPSSMEGGRPGRRLNSWTIEEVNGPDGLEPPPPDEPVARAIRYLGLPALQPLPGSTPVIAETSPPLSTSAAAILTAPPAAAGLPAPTRFGQELAQCHALEDAIALTRKRLPRLKPLLVCRFLSMIGYPIATPWPDVMRFCADIGLLRPAIEPENNGHPAAGSASSNIIAQAMELTAALQRPARLACIPLSHLVALLAAYSGALKVTNYRPTCSRTKPSCDICRITIHCTRLQRIQAELQTASSASDAAPRRITIKEWAVDERPRERLLAGERLSNAELLGLILRTGTGNLSAVELGRRLIAEFGSLHDLDRATPADIIARMKGSGIGPAKAAEICAAIELGRRVSQPAADIRAGLRRITTSRDIFETFRAQFKPTTQEEFYVMVLNTKNCVQKTVRVSLGTLNTSIVHPRDVFGHAMRGGAYAVIFVHNHPSGDPTPSEQDFALTARLVEAGRLLGVEIYDHVIIGSHNWYSFADHGKLRRAY